MRKKIKTLLVIMMAITMLYGCSSESENVQVVENTEAEENVGTKLLFNGKYLGVNMEYDSETGEYYIDTNTVGLIAEDGTIKNIVEELGGKYECFKFSNKAKWQIGVTEWEVKFIRSKSDDNDRVAYYEAYRNGEGISICNGQKEVIKEDNTVNSFKLSIKDLETLLQVQTEINYEDNTINIIPVYTN